VHGHCNEGPGAGALRGWRAVGTRRLRPTRCDPAPFLMPLSIPGAASYRGAADGQVVDADRREPHTHRDRLTLLTAGAHALVELEVAADARDAAQRLGAVADQRRALDRHRHAPVLDEIRLARREDELRSEEHTSELQSRVD